MFQKNQAVNKSDPSPKVGHVSKSLAARMSLLSFLWITLLMSIGGVAITWAFNRSAERSLDNQLLAYVDILISSTMLDANGKVYIHKGDAFFGAIPRYWQVTVNGKPLIKSSHLKNWIKVKSGAGSEITRVNVIDKYGTSITAVEKTIMFPGRQEVVYLFGMQSAIAQAFMDEDKAIFNKALVFILVPVAVLLLILAFIQIRLQSRPLQEIQECLEDIESGKLSRLPDVFPSEIQPLAEHVNTLLDYSEEVVERYRTFASNMSHALKTPLTVISSEAAVSHGKLALTIKEQAQIMLALIDRNLARVKSAGTANILTARTDIASIVERITQGFAKIYDKKAELVIDDRGFFRGDEGDAYEFLGNIIENACKYAKQSVQVRLFSQEDMICFSCEDDGPGIPQEEYETVVKRGTRLDESKPGHGIGLPIARDLVALYNGTMTLEPSSLGGLKVVVSLPKAK
ncbi:MAG: HAMP domain-containing histidine kinase [Alphaproteobacteria bacterium]|nr:HAMP domain-containing histidine kinase [Alphaproteobacteria bacterium]